MPFCPRCRARWSGDRPCHCSGCHRTFTGLSAFDTHRSLLGDHGRCADPALLRDTAGRPRLVQRPDGRWGSPDTMTPSAIARRTGDAE